MTSRQESLVKIPQETTKPLSFREYLGVLRPQRQQPTGKEIAELAANPNKPLTFSEYLGAIFPKR